ncbi:protein NLRC5, partial [Pimephales promelas]
FLCPAAEEACQYVRRVMGKNPLLLEELNLINRELEFNRVRQLAALLQDKHCKLKIIQLNNNSITAEGCAVLTSAFNSNPSNLTKLDLSGNELGDSGIKNICCLLENPQCRLEKLKLSDCSITEKSYEILTSSLKSNSHLKDLDLRGNYPGRSGVKMITDMMQRGWSKLKNISFLNNAAAEDACKYLTEVLKTDPLQLTELDLSGIALDQHWEKLSAFLVDSYCQVDQIKLNNYEMTQKSCAVLATVLSSKNTILKEINLNNSRLLDSGVKLICEGLKKSKLKILKLSNCSITEEGYKALASALRSNPSHLIELDLTGNDPGQSGVKQLYDLLQYPKCQLKTWFLSPAADKACQYVRGIVGENPLLLRELNLSDRKLEDSNLKNLVPLLQDKHCKLNTLMLRNCDLTEESCSALATVLRSNSSLKELDMSNNDNLQDSGVKKLEDALKNTNCRLEKIRLRNCDLTKESCSNLATVLRSNSSLKELDMSNNNLQDSGVKKLQIALENINCTLEKLRLSDCSITEEGYIALASALRSNPSHLIELDLTGNDPGESGVKELDDLQQDRYNSLKTLRFLGHAADEACQYVRGIVGKNPLLMRELNLSKRKLGDTGVNQIAALLKDKHCQLNTLNLRGCSITEKQCLILTPALKSNPSHLRELDLSGNKIRNTGVKHLCDILKDSHCKLERLRLRGCEMTDEGCSAVTSALKLNPSHLRELNLSENKLGDSGVNNLSDLLMIKSCKLEKLDLCGCSITEKQCHSLSSSLCSNLSHLRELDLSVNKLENKGVKHLCDILKDSHCKLERLSLKDCGITDVSALTQSLSETQALQFLKELDLTNNKIDDSGKQLNDMIKDSNCKLSLDKEGWMSTLGGWFTSKSKETVKSTGTALSSPGGTQEQDEAQSVRSSDRSKKHKSGSSGKGL